MKSRSKKFNKKKLIQGIAIASVVGVFVVAGYIFKDDIMKQAKKTSKSVDKTDGESDQPVAPPAFAAKLRAKHNWKYVNPNIDKRLKDRSAAFSMAIEKLRGSDVFFGLRCDYDSKKFWLALWGPDMENTSMENIPVRIIFDNSKSIWPILNKALDGRVLLFKDLSALPLIKKHQYMQVILHPNGKNKLTFSFGLNNSMINIEKAMADCRK